MQICIAWMRNTAQHCLRKPDMQDKSYTAVDWTCEQLAIHWPTGVTKIEGGGTIEMKTSVDILL